MLTHTLQNHRDHLALSMGMNYRIDFQEGGNIPSIYVRCLLDIGPAVRACYPDGRYVLVNLRKDT